MSERDSTSESASGQPNLFLTPDEKRVFGQLFQAADSEGLGVVTGELAVKFFEKSGLNQRVLGEIWGIADTENRGLLTQMGFSVALRLIGQAQAGQHPRPELALHPGPLPRFEGVNITYPPTAPPTTSSPPPGHISQAPPGGPRVPQLTEADCKRFTDLFQVSGAVDGILPGDAAKGIFTRAKLPIQTLGLIWGLADRNQKGALTCPEFVVAMHLINCTKNGSLQALPTVLPPALYEAASGRPSARPQERRPTGGRVPPNIPTVPPIPKQFSGGRAQSPLSRQFTPPGSLHPNLSGGAAPLPDGDWAITPREKQEFDNLFNSVDRTGKGFITGEEAVPFFSNSKLPEDVLATIWDLADITKAGRLSKDEFAIAMYLIRQQRSRRDGQGLPETLPLNLIPPRMRAQLSGNAPQSQFYQAPPAPPPAASSMDDLFGLESFGSASAVPPANAPPGQAIGGYDSGFPGPAKTGASAVPTTQSSMFTLPEQKFVPTSQFGQMLAASATGGSTSSLPARSTPSAMDDLLGGEDEQMKKITPDTMELANLSNQIGSLTKQTQELKNKRASTEQELNAFNTQKQDIEARLAQIKTLYEREAKDVKMVEDRLVAARNEVIKMRQEYAITEASYNDLAAKKQEIVTQVEQDQREIQDLKDRMNMVNAENAQVKQQLEKLRLDAKQHKGRVAISKKQLATSEAERDKLKSEIDELRSAAASTQSPHPPGSPTPSQASKNPFYRTRSPPATATDSPYQSPYDTGNSNFVSQQQQQPQQSQQTNYEDVFGPAFDIQSAPGPPPSTTFSHTGQSGPSVVSASEGPFDHSTPPTSPPASSYQNSPSSFDNPPPPFSASQMTSAFLPLPISRTESLTSSVQVNAPTSTHDGNLSRPDTPTNWMNAPAAVDSLARDRDIFMKPAERRESTSVRSDPGTEGRPGFSREDNKSPFAAAISKNLTGPPTSSEGQKEHEKKDSFGFPTSSLSGLPGAFPSPLKPSATGESTRSNKSVSFAPRPDPFGLNRVDEMAPSASKDDMDAAFASFGLPKANLQGQNTGGSNHSGKFDKEFPPIEFPQDDDSDSDVGGGFDDNFTSASPVLTRPSLVPPTTGAPPEGTEGSKPGTPLPAQKTTDTNLNPFPHEGKFDSQSKSPQSSQLFSAPPTNTKALSKPIVDEFDDDAFGDLVPAQEADGKGDHDFGVLAANDGFDDFDPVFDSPAPKARGEKSLHTADDEEFTKFNFNIDTPAQAQQQEHTGASAASGLKTASNEDWDRIFAGLDDSKQQLLTTGAESQGANTSAAAGTGEGNGNSGTEKAL
ncbi:hypothetical protein L211DRAFT_835615 [Terfezia boudieri ATCC MYA-4762]|uniref:EF-hand n=1 Tax=Terfezia boudieri ATCC MYA-4762 TaxID=1051890 RepID=A0A3N4LZZ7_9PEZI|nr:hypothetical protein L211DRAFT_835615 [Terfezia boudieri ATCC MYA-4762]